MQRRAFLAAALLLLLPHAAWAQRDERRRLEERAQERRDQRRRDEERAEERRQRRRRDDELADERREQRRDEQREELNKAPAPPHTPTRPLDQPIPPPD